MDANYDIWFRDPRTLIHNILSNPGFNGGFDFTPYQEYDSNGIRRYHDLMSANWAWRQALYGIYYSLLIFHASFCI